jgi:hypothetical protein
MLLLNDIVFLFGLLRETMAIGVRGHVAASYD